MSECRRSNIERDVEARIADDIETEKQEPLVNHNVEKRGEGIVSAASTSQEEEHIKLTNEANNTSFARFSKLAILYVMNNSNKIYDLLRFEGRLRVPNLNALIAVYILKDDSASNYFVDRKIANHLIQKSASIKDVE